MTRYPRKPTPGPKWPNLRFSGLFGATTDDALSMGAPDEAFEKARTKK